MTSFAFVERPYWRPHYLDDIHDLLKEIPRYSERVQKFIKNPLHKEFIEGYMDAYHVIYTAEICWGERITTMDLKNFERAMKKQNPGRIDQKIQNLSKAVYYIFGNMGVLQHEFTVDLAKRLNKLIGDGLFTNAGDYRVKDAKPAGCNHFYTQPIAIEEHMNELFKEVNTQMNLEICDWLQVATCFFIKFLHIHPFSNGNGRTARILLSALLLKCTFIPVSLFSSSFRNTCNREYLHTLEEAHIHNNHNLVASLIIESTHRSLQMFLNTLDVDDDNL